VPDRPTIGARRTSRLGRGQRARPRTGSVLARYGPKYTAATPACNPTNLRQHGSLSPYDPTQSQARTRKALRGNDLGAERAVRTFGPAFGQE